MLPDKARIITGEGSEVLSVRKLPELTKVEELIRGSPGEGITCADLSPDGSRLTYCSGHALRPIQLRDLASGQKNSTFGVRPPWRDSKPPKKRQAE